MEGGRLGKTGAMSDDIHYELLREYLGKIEGGIGIAFSGGVDSTYLLKMALESCAGPVIPFLLVSSFLPERERKWAYSVANKIGLPLREVPWNPFEFHNIIKNREDRCYCCKYTIYRKLWSICHKAGLSNLLDGTQQDDLNRDRPGLRAIHELSVKTPLAYCKLDKNKIRMLSAKLGLPTWDRPSESCLATRVASGTIIRSDLLKKIEASEDFLMGCLKIESARFYVQGDRAYLHIAEGYKSVVERHWGEIQTFSLEKGFKNLFLYV